MSLVGFSWTTEAGERITVAQDPSSWSPQYLDVWIDEDGELSYSCRLRSLVEAAALTHSKEDDMARSRTIPTEPVVTETPKPDGSDEHEAAEHAEVIEPAKPAKPKKPSIAEVAGKAILPLLEEHADGLTNAEIAELGKKTIPRNKSGFYVAEGLSWLRSQDHQLVKDGRKHVLKT